MRAVWLLVAAVGVAALWDLGVALRPGLDPVPAEALSAAVERVQELRSPGTQVVFSPLFGPEEASVLAPLGGGPDLPVASVRASRRILVLDREEAPMGGFGAPEETWPLEGGLLLSSYAPAGSASGRVVVMDLFDQLRPETLSIERPPGTLVSRCPQARDDGGYGCPSEPEWLHVAATTQQIDGRSERCLWAHPTAGGAVVMELPAPPTPAPGHHLELEVETALNDDAVRHTQGGATVTTLIRQHGKGVGRVARDNRIGWAEGSFRVDPGAPIRLEVMAARDGRRHHCLRARVVEAPDAEEEGS